MEECAQHACQQFRIILQTGSGGVVCLIADNSADIIGQGRVSQKSVEIPVFRKRRAWKNR
jgi:hypothetical protein